MELRNYQKKALEKAHCWFEEETTYPLIVLPTGAGKTIVFATLIKQLYEDNPGKRFLILAHRQELIRQAVDKIQSVWPDAPIGILAASLKEFNQTAPIVVASRDTLASRTRLDKSYPYDYIIIDEAHHVGTEKSSRYRKIIDHFEEIGCPKVLGVTATPYRMGQGWIYGMDDHFFGGVAYRAEIIDLIKEKFLCRLSAYKVNDDAVIDASTARVKFKGGDYRESDLERIAMGDNTIIAIINDWIKKAYTKGRTSTVFFCVSVLHANKMAMFLKQFGIAAACVTAETPLKERVQILEDFEAGKINALCNVAVLTEGWDAPRTDCIGLLRPTKSLGLYVQICGRGMRPWENKKDCLLLDYGENMKRHGCIDVATPERNKTGEELDENDGIWICDCLAVNDSLYRECIECGQPKPKRIETELLEPVPQEKEAAETTIAAEGNVLSDMADEKFKPVEKQVKVTKIWAEQSVSKNNNRYLKINFKSPEQYWPYSHSMMVEMRGKPRQVAERQWKKMSRGLSTLPYAVSTAERIVNEDKIFEEVKEIRIRKEGKYWNVINVYF